MHWILAPLLLLCSVALGDPPTSNNNISIGGVRVGTSTSGMDEAAGSAAVSGKGFITDSVIGPSNPNVKPPKGLPSTGGGIVITSNSNVHNGSMSNKVGTKVEAFRNNSKPDRRGGSRLFPATNPFLKPAQYANLFPRNDAVTQFEYPDNPS